MLNAQRRDVHRMKSVASEKCRPGQILWQSKVSATRHVDPRTSNGPWLPTFDHNQIRSLRDPYPDSRSGRLCRGIALA